MANVELYKVRIEDENGTKAFYPHTSTDVVFDKTGKSVDELLGAKLDKTGEASNVTNTFTQSSSLTNLKTGEKLAVSLGKIMKAIADLISHLGNKSNPHAVTKAQVGLSDVDNTSDLNKPISNAMKNALNEKANSSHTHTKSQITDFPTSLPANGGTSDNSNKLGDQLPAYYATKQSVDNVNTKLKDNLNQNRIELTNSSYYPTTICYRSGQMVYMKCSGTLTKEIPSDAGYVVATESMMPEEYRPNADITAYPNISFAGKNIKVEIKTTGRVIFTSPEKLPVGFGINMHFVYATGKSNF